MRNTTAYGLVLPFFIYRKRTKRGFQENAHSVETWWTDLYFFQIWKYEGERNGRYFTDFTIDTFADFVQEIHNLQIEEHWITGDVRPGRGEEKWLNLIMQKK